ncbi:uncharacterized protein LOC128857037 [Anastrepha ludens]|uniref:uncharacterized protein LOC128857037 n=1 Tax=Anastrepha ludens TaxID=28586 RepID=UPI0023AEA55A|nr:uncharacterized protein LOC128857037 [Anastrepha ludens]
MDFDDTMDLVIIILLLNEARKYLDIISNGHRSQIRQVNERRRLTRRITRNPQDCEGEDNLFAQYLNKTCQSDPEEFRSSVHMSQAAFELLFNLVELDLFKCSMRHGITPKCRLFVTLLYLANGNSKKMPSSAFELGLPFVRRIVSETCEVLWNSLCDTYLPMKQTPDWVELSRQFESKLQLPNCVGAIDTRTIELSSPNKKGRYSVAILATCDASYTFTGIDAVVFRRKDYDYTWGLDFADNLFEGGLNLPEDKILPNSEIEFPYYFVGDNVCPLKPHIMKLYPGKLLSQRREIFNSRLDRARQVIDNAFGILAARWRILTNPLNLSPRNMQQVLKATLLLHNFARTHDSTYCPPGYVDRYEGDTLFPGDWRDEIIPLEKTKRFYSNNATQSAYKLRDSLSEYFENN